MAEGKPVTIEGMPTGEDEGKVFVQLWRPVIIRGHAFNTGDSIAVQKDKVEFTPAEGGDFAWLYATVTAEKNSPSRSRGSSHVSSRPILTRELENNGSSSASNSRTRGTTWLP